MTLDKENKNLISKALMIRFVAIYVDNDIEINNENLNLIIENTGKKLYQQIQENNNRLLKEENNKKKNNSYENEKTKIPVLIIIIKIVK